MELGNLWKRVPALKKLYPIPYTLYPEFMENNEIDRQLGELWKKASGKEYVPEPPLPARHYSEAHVETVQFLKNNFSKAESDWKRLLEVKESNIRDLSAQLDETRAPGK